jgi:hypothetical protein
MKTKCILFTIVVLLALAPVSALAAKQASVSGSIQGYYCVTQGKTCPVGQEDPMAATETVFVLHVKGANYYFVPNVDRAVLARHLNEMVTVNGVMSKDMKAIHASEIFVDKSGKSRKVWSSNMEDDIYRDVWGTLPLGGE